jgi:hypothetical protein
MLLAMHVPRTDAQPISSECLQPSLVSLMRLFLLKVFILAFEKFDNAESSP